MSKISVGMNTRLSAIQVAFLQKVCFLLFLQSMLLLMVVWLVHRFFPQRICLLTCHKWLDLFFFLALIIIPMYLSRYGTTITIRYIAFFTIAALMAYVLGLQYNIISLLSGDEKKTAMTFMKAVFFVLALLIINLLLLPFLIKYLSTIYALSSTFFVCLIGLILWGLFIEKGFLIWMTVSLIVFMGLLTTDLVLLTNGCRKRNTPGCDPLNGATLLYMDLVNLLQQIFILMNSNNQ